MWIPSWGDHRVPNCNPVVGEAAALSSISWLKMLCRARSPKRGGTNRKRKRRRCCIESRLRPPGKEVQIRQTTAAEVQVLRESRRLESANKSRECDDGLFGDVSYFFIAILATDWKGRIFIEAKIARVINFAIVLIRRRVWLNRIDVLNYRARWHGHSSRLNYRRTRINYRKMLPRQEKSLQLDLC